MRLSSTVGSGLWLAASARNDGVEHPFTVPAPWRRPLMHRFSSRCRVVGLRVVRVLSEPRRGERPAAPRPGIMSSFGDARVLTRGKEGKMPQVIAATFGDAESATKALAT